MALSRGQKVWHKDSGKQGKILTSYGGITAMVAKVHYGPFDSEKDFLDEFDVVKPPKKKKESVDELIDRVVNGDDPEDIIKEITTTGAIAGLPKPMGIVRTTRTKKRDGYGAKGSFGESRDGDHLSEAGYAAGAPTDTFLRRATVAGANQNKGTHGGTPWDKKVKSLYGNNVPRGSGKSAESFQEVSPIGAGGVSGPDYHRQLALSRVDPHRLNPSPGWPIPDKKKQRVEVIDAFLSTEGSIDALIKKLENDPKVKNPQGLAHWIGMRKKKKK